MKMNVRRAQAAMEFLTTYGWAILVIVLVLTALTWLGVFSPWTNVPSRCTFEAGVQCNSFNYMSPDGTTVSLSQLRITNRLPERIIVCQVLCSSSQPSVGVPSSCASTPMASLGVGSTTDLINGAGLPNVPCYAQFGSTPLTAQIGEMVTTSVWVYYLKESDTGLPGARVMRGDLVARLS
ncbi:Uncharacterised protein [Candidatus Burarchaeum australiense]|nr:Uncharacterised protein [Candidatus Burarchaeum australiense]